VRNIFNEILKRSKATDKKFFPKDSHLLIFI